MAIQQRDLMTSPVSNPPESAGSSAPAGTEAGKPVPETDASQVAAAHAAEVESGKRFEFGRNWANFLRVLNDERIETAIQAVSNMLGVTSLEGKRFLDVGSGSGLSSLAARRLGAEVWSFDYDPESVACTSELRRRYYPEDSQWKVFSGSVLDQKFLGHLGTFDVVYSWGVLHHTGQMWQAITNVLPLVAENGQLFIAIYNDQGTQSKRWKRIKQIYCSGTAGKAAMSSIVIPFWVGRSLAADLKNFRNPLEKYTSYSKRRGMSVWHDWHDWLGGYPFEVARPEEIFSFLRKNGFELEALKTAGGTLGCNEFVARRVS